MAKFGIAPSHTAQDRRRGDAHIAGYYVPKQRHAVGGDEVVRTG
jgi:hypothetical protein